MPSYPISPNWLEGPGRADQDDGAEEGTIVAILEGGLYRVRMGREDKLIAHLSSSLRMAPLRLLPGDRVLVKRAALNPSRGRVLRRLPGG